MVLCDLNLPNSVTHKTAKKFRNYRKANWELFQENLAMVDWEKVFSSGEPETVWTRFSQIISQLIDIAVPIRGNKSKLQKPLWETTQVRKARKKRNKAERLYLASKSDDHKSL